MQKTIEATTHSMQARSRQQLVCLEVCFGHLKSQNLSADSGDVRLALCMVPGLPLLRPSVEVHVEQLAWHCRASLHGAFTEDPLNAPRIAPVTAILSDLLCASASQV